MPPSTTPKAYTLGNEATLMNSATSALTKLTAMHGAHQHLGAEFLFRDGWKLPARYSSTDSEVATVLKGGGIFDISPIGKLSFQGAEVLAELPRTLALPDALTVGKAIRCASPTASEDSRESVTVAALAYDEALVLTSPGSRDSIAATLEEAVTGSAHLIDLTSAWAGIGIMGPRSVDALARIVELDLDPDKFVDGACAQAKSAEVHSLIVRGDVSGHYAYQLYVTRDYGEYMWEALVHGGKGVGVSPIGIEAFEQISSDHPGIPW